MAATFRLFTQIFAQRGIRFSFVDMCDANNVSAAIADDTKGIWIETPSNPLLNLVDNSGRNGHRQTPRHYDNCGQHVSFSLSAATV